MNDQLQAQRDRIRQRDNELEAERVERVKQLSERVPNTSTAARMFDEQAQREAELKASGQP